MNLHKPNLDVFKKEPTLKKAVIILINSYEAADSFYTIFRRLRGYDQSKPKKGPPTHEEQDLLRAMLLFSTAGLDAVVKQLIRDSLEGVVDKDEAAGKKFETYIERKIKKSDGDELKDAGLNIKFLARILVSKNSRDVLISDMVYNLTNDSLQSEEQLLKVAEFFAIKKDEIISGKPPMKSIFDARNQITHEMDINFNQKSKKMRRARTEAEMVKMANEIIKTAESFIAVVYNKIKI